MNTNQLEAQSEVTTQDHEPTQQDATQNIIEAQNPSTEEMKTIVGHINTNYNFSVETKAVEFKFKKSVDKVTKIETIRKPVELAIPYPSVQGIVDILESDNSKEIELLMEAVQGIVNSAARDILYEDTKLNASTFPVDRISWAAIAAIPKVQRRGGGIPKEVWEKFATDYCEVMPEVTGKNIDQIANAAKILVGKLASARTNEPVLNFMVEQLALYAANSPNAEEFVEVVSFLTDKAETFLNVDPADLLDNL